MYPTYPAFTEGMHPGEFIATEASGWRSRDNGILASGQQNVIAGTILGALTTQATEVQTITVTGAPTGGNLGLEYQQQEAFVPYPASAAAVQAALQALPNVGAGNMTVSGNAGGPYSVSGAGTLANQNLTAIVGDASQLTGGTSPSVSVVVGTQGEPQGRFAALNLSATDGSQTPVAILYATTDATNGDQKCVVMSRDCEVNASEIAYPAGATATQIATINTALASHGIIVRPAV